MLLFTREAAIAMPQPPELTLSYLVFLNRLCGPTDLLETLLIDVL